MFENVTELRSSGVETREREREREKRRDEREGNEKEEVEEVEDKGTEKIVDGKRRMEYIVVRKRETKITERIRVKSFCFRYLFDHFLRFVMKNKIIQFLYYWIIYR